MHIASRTTIIIASVATLWLTAGASPNTADAQSQTNAQDAPTDTEPNAFMTVTAWRGGKLLKKWSGPALWRDEDGVFIGTVKSGQITWVDGSVTGLQVETDSTGQNGIAIAKWLPERANMVKVAISKHGFGDNPAGGVGKANRAKDKDKSKPPALASESPKDPTTKKKKKIKASVSSSSAAVGPDGADQNHDDRGDASKGDEQNAASLATVSGKGKSKKRNLATGPGSSDKGKIGGGPTGEEVGKTRDEGGVGNTYSTSLDGKDDGDPEGGKGGDGTPGDAGARGAFALFGGILNVPRGWRPAVEVALIGSEALTPSSAFKAILKRGVRRSAVKRVRKKLRRLARSYARAEVKRMKKQFADELEAMTRKQREHLLRATEYRKQRQYFDKVEQGAKNRQRHLQRKLDADPDNKKLQGELSDARKIEEAAAVKPVEGRFPVNHENAGKTYPVGNIDPKTHPEAIEAIQSRGMSGVPFTREGYPDFTPWIHGEPGGIAADVRITYTGRTRASDFNRARDEMRRKLDDPEWTRPADHTWHHHEDVGRMVLVPTELHRAVRHTGGIPNYRMSTGDFDAYK